MEDEVFTFPKEYPGNIQEQTIARLAALQEGQKYTIHRVNRINGSIRELYGRTETNEKDLIRHAGECPLRGRVEELNNLLTPTKADALRIAELNTKVSELEGTVKEQVTERKANARWVRGLQPILLGLGAALISTIITLMLLHSSAFVKADVQPQPQPAATAGGKP